MKKPDYSPQVLECAELIKQSENIVVLTGAGISTSCGIPDFRGPKGLYVTKRYDPDTIFDINYFLNDPKPFYQFARDFLQLEEKLTPSFTHSFFSELEKTGKLKCVITQNIDSLHQKAGSKNVLEIHGSFWKSHCLGCGKEYSYKELKNFMANEDVPVCSYDGGVIKPDIVFFGENVKNLTQAINVSQEADLFLVIGSSCVVHPAAGLPRYTSGKIVIVNYDKVSLPLMNVVLEVNEDLDEFFKKVNTSF